MARDNDHRQFGVFRPDRFGQAQTIHVPRHAHIGNHQCQVWQARQGCQGVIGVGAVGDAVAEVRYCFAHQPPQDVVIFHYQYMASHRFPLSLAI